MRLIIALFLFAVLLVAAGCTTESERILADRSRPRTAIVADLRRLGQEKIRPLLDEAVRGLESTPDTLALARRTGLLLEAVLGLPGGREHAVSALVRLQRRRVLPPPVWQGMAALGKLHADWLLQEAFQPASPALAAIRPELVAVAALHAGTNGRALFVRALSDYALQPELFHPAFTRLPLADFQRLADFSRRELRELALVRLRRRYPPGGDVLVLLKKIAADGLPVLAVLLAEELFAPALSRYRALPRRDPEQKLLRKKAMHLYWFLTGLRKKFEGRSEDEERLYALIVKQVYDVQSGQ